MTTNWSHSICRCFTSKNAGLNCCVQHTCCQPCIWASSLSYAGFPEAYLAGFVVGFCNQTIADDITGYFMRRKLVDKYQIDESAISTFLLTCCCPCLSRVQEVDTIIELENLDYGCVELVPKKITDPVVEPKQTKKLPPTIQKIEREKHHTNHKK